MALHKMAQERKVSTFTPNEIIRDQLVSSIRDNKIQEKLLKEPNLMYIKNGRDLLHSRKCAGASASSVGWWIPP